jgi:D-alanyl-D-alanine dipeptidase
MLRLAIVTLVGLWPIATQAETRPAGFVDAAAVVPGLIVDMRYAGPDNFVGVRIDGYEKPICLLTREAASALAKAARDLAARGLRLKVFDCYRPQRAVAHFRRWAHDATDRRTKPHYYPAFDKRSLFALGYLATRSRHSSGSTVDVTLARSDGSELDMGTPFDFFSPRSGPTDHGVPAAAQANRRLLADTMRRHSFRGNEREWWHFTLRGEPFAGRYFNFPVQ